MSPNNHHGGHARQMRFTSAHIVMTIETAMRTAALRLLRVLRLLRLMVIDPQAVCSKICENGGFCTSAETCECAMGWQGDDCTTPKCAAACGQ